MHVWFVLPDGNRIGRQHPVIPAEGSIVQIERDGPRYFAGRIEHLVSEKERHRKIVVRLAPILRGWGDEEAA